MLTNETGQVETKLLLEKTYALFESGEFPEAQETLEHAHGLDFENPEVKVALRACGFWCSRAEIAARMGMSAERADFLYRQWEVFTEDYKAQFDSPFAQGSLSIGQWVLNQALDDYRKADNEGVDPRINLQIGRCLKALGAYAECVAHLERAMKEIRGNKAAFFAEIADAYALVGETSIAKVFLREALFHDPCSLDTRSLVSPLFRRLVEKVEDILSHEDPAFLEWLPVYGTLFGVLDINRELSPVEYGKLKQSIYAMKSELTDGDDGGRLTPRLINRFFWLIDHYKQIGEDRTAIEEALMNIKLLSPSVYRLYTE